MKKSMLIKICSLALAIILCLLTAAGCDSDKKNTSTSDTNSKISRPTASEADTSSEETLTVEDSLEEDSITAKTNSSDKTSSKKTVTTTTTQNISFSYDNIPLKKGINFGELNFDIDLSYDSYMLQAKYYDLIREKGFDHIRVPVDFFRYMGSAPDYKIDEEFMSKMDTIITLSLSAGLKIVLDAHHFSGELQTNVNGELPRYLSMWEQLSVRYQKYPSGLVFELINEPGNWSEIKNGGPDVVTPKKIMSLQERAIKIIRKTNPARLIIHATQWNNGINQLMDTEPLLPDDKNIIMSIHDYYPGKFTHQGATWSEYEGGTPGGVYWNDEEMRYQLELDFAIVKAYQEKYGRPVWVGEFGAMRNETPEGQRALYAKAIVEIMNDAKCGWCWFDFASNFGLFDISTDDWYADGTVDALFQ